MRPPNNPSHDTEIEGALVSKILWLLSGMTLSLAACAATATHLKFAHAQEVGLQFGAYIGILIAVRVYARWRGLNDARLRLCIDIAATFALNALGDLVLQYSAATLAAPDLTAWVQRADHALGFDWFDYAHGVAGVAPVCLTLMYCYGGWTGGMVAAMAALALARRFDAIGEFAIGFSLTCLSIIAVFALIDARSLESVAAYSLPGFHHPAGAGPGYLQTLTALRSGASRTFDLTHISPLISFPSLHGATALLLVAAVRGLGVWRYPFIAFNVLVLVSTLSEGGHNVTDVIAGAVVACAAILAAGPIYRALRLRAGAPRAAAALASA